MVSGVNKQHGRQAAPVLAVQPLPLDLGPPDTVDIALFNDDFRLEYLVRLSRLAMNRISASATVVYHMDEVMSSFDAQNFLDVTRDVFHYNGRYISKHGA